ncbi:MAG: laccase domain-containing protein [Actinobacteria bacterium]|nr:MAG: laccase domain-containing protein [Actinomycetota bacterium]
MIRWEAEGYEIAFTTRIGGVSEGPYASLNLGRKSGDDPARADENRRMACEAIGADLEKLALNYQVHSSRVLRAVSAMRGEHADGLWTDEPDLPVLAMSADCLPIVLVRTGPAKPAVAVLHAGWKGLLAGIVAAGAQALRLEAPPAEPATPGRKGMGCGPLTAAIGPGIGPCCYEVGEEVAAPFRERFGDDVVRESRLDLWTSAERALRAAGVEQVDRVDRCTACEPETFFSHRRDAGRTGRQGVIAYVAG